MTPLVIILGPPGAGRADAIRELTENAWPEGRKIRILREKREAGDASDSWEFKDGQALLPAPGE